MPEEHANIAYRHRRAISVQLSPEAARVIAGCVADDDEQTRDGDGQGRIIAPAAVWADLRAVFPLDSFVGSENQEPDPEDEPLWRVGCTRCKGTGRIPRSDHRSARNDDRWLRCERCKGTGSVPDTADPTGAIARDRARAGIIE